MLTADLTSFNTTIALIKASRDVIIEASTGGLSNLTSQERILPVFNPEAELGSLNVGSVNFGDQVYCNAVPEVRQWAQRMAESGVKPSLEVFDTGHLLTAFDLIERGLVQPPCNFSFIFGVRWGMEWCPELLRWLVKKLPDGSRWGAIFVGSSGFAPHLAAVDAGASFLRVGFEDSPDLGGVMADNNAQLTAALRQKLENRGFNLASVHEARTILGISSMN